MWYRCKKGLILTGLILDHVVGVPIVLEQQDPGGFAVRLGSAQPRFTFEVIVSAQRGLVDFNFLHEPRRLIVGGFYADLVDAGVVGGVVRWRDRGVACNA